MITIQAESVSELKKICSELFPSAEVTVTPPKKETKKADPAPPKEEKKVETPPAADAGKVTVEVPDAAPLTHDKVLDRIKALKASTVPDIIDRVVAWRDGKKLPKLPEMSVQQLTETLEFVNSLEG